MAVLVNGGVVAIDGEDEPKAASGMYAAPMQFYIGEGSVSFTGSGNMGINTNVPSCRLEVRTDGAVGIGW